MNSSKRNRELFDRACQVIPGGVNSPVRAFRAVGGTPLFIRSAQGCFVEDASGGRYLDYLGAWGPLILGHAHPEVVSELANAALLGFSYGAPTEREIDLAETICRLVPSIEMVRLVNSGTEATMSALRLARAFTGRPMIVKFDGCYHGHSDCLLVKAGSGVLTLGLPDTPGVPDEFTKLTLSLPFNNTSRLEEAFDQFSDRIAAVILEPVPANMGVVLPEPGYLERVAQITRNAGALLIADEVMTGFRVARGGAQERFGFEADLTCLGKIVGGGLPIGAYGGKREIMEWVAPQGPVYQAGTLSGNPLAVAAGLKTLQILEKEDPYEQLEQLTRELSQGLTQSARECELPLTVQSCGSLLTPFFQPGPVLDYDSAKASTSARYNRFFHCMLEQGIYFAPSQFEASFLSTCHTHELIQETIEKATVAFREIRSSPTSD